LGNVVLGYDTTIPVTMEDIIHHAKAVSRGSSQALLVADMPFLSYQTDQSKAIENAGRLLQAGGVQAVKLGGVVVIKSLSKLLPTSAFRSWGT
jgi:3-methyl-2-oxobutanoate hydroxymethyltransferase